MKFDYREIIPMLGESVSEVHFPRKAVIFSEGITLSHIYIIRSGTVKVSLQEASGQEYIIRMGTEGSLLGYQSVLTFAASPVTAIATSDVCAYSIPRAAFLSLIKNNHAIDREVMAMLSAQLENTQRRMFSLAYKSVPARIAESIMTMIRYHGYMTDGRTINAPIYRKDLAEYAGITVESTIRTLGQMKKNGWIDTRNKYIVIKDLKELIRTSKDE